jgi:hypothetical protein
VTGRVHPFVGCSGSFVPVPAQHSFGLRCAFQWWIAEHGFAEANSTVLVRYKPSSHSWWCGQDVLPRHFYGVTDLPCSTAAQEISAKGAAEEQNEHVTKDVMGSVKDYMAGTFCFTTQTHFYLHGTQRPGGINNSFLNSKLLLLSYHEAWWQAGYRAFRVK